MKNLLETKVSKAQLKAIVGDTVKYNFPTKIVIKSVGVEVEKELPDTLKNIIKNTPGQLLSSTDERFDKKHPVVVALERISNTGLSKSIVAKIRNNKNCQKKQDIVGSFKFFTNFISDQHKDYIINLLKETRLANVLKFGEKYYA